MKALVTGGAGFIGSNVSALLLQKGWQVRVLDDLSSGYACNLDGLDVDFQKGDIRATATATDACSGMDVVFHLAASVGRQRSLDHPQLDSEINVIGTLNILEGMRIHGVPKIVYSSSAAIFGEPSSEIIAEDHPQNADSPYGVSKLAAEKMILAYQGIYGIHAVCLRYFNIYGVNQRFDLYGNVIPIFAQRLKDGDPITIYGDGLQTRDFVNVRDVASANYLAATSDRSGVFNLGSGSEITIRALSEFMQKISGRTVETIYAPARPADVLHCRADAGKALECLNFQASIDLREGLRDYWSWFSTQKQTEER
ncbi:MAG: GDP-mannose 4,6-dehydratase [Candidatus Limiplasma sp.]|nr:GDP-mannose 4,6-dehydratase [Candidatus Limiplasma sp.]